MLGYHFRTKRAALAIAFILATLTSRAAAADSFTVAWDPNPESSVVGYYVYVGTTSGAYSTVVDVGKATRYTFASAVSGTKYFISVAAYAAGPLVGAKAAELVTSPGGAPAVTNPGAQSTARGKAVSLAIKASDPTNETLTFSALSLPAGLTINPTSGVISGTPTTAGTSTVSVTVRDTSGNVTTVGFTWTIVATDAAAPTISITSPTTGTSYSTADTFVTLSGVATDDIGVTAVSWANNKGGSGTAAGTANWSVVVPVQTGANVLTVTAKDAAGKTATDTLTVTVAAASKPDTAPTVKITSPTASASYTSTSATLSMNGTAADDTSVTKVSWSNNRGGSGVATGTTTWSVSGIALLSGANVITITAQDGTGHSTTATLSVSYTAPSTPSTALQLKSLTSDKASPQVLGTSMKFTATATGGTAPYQFKWRVYNGSSWSVAQAWSTSNTFTWKPTAVGSGYQVQVWARSAGKTADAAENSASSATQTFVINPVVSTTTKALALTSLTASLKAPQALGQTITFTAAATGGKGPYQYKWWIFDGYDWTVVQDWSTSKTFVWRPTRANLGYRIGVWVRSAGSSANASDNDASNGSMAFPIVTRAGVGG